MSDLIKREDAMGAVQDHFNANGFKGYDDGQKMMDRIKALPSAEAVQGEWIPCSEMLPDADDCPMDCMVTRKSKFVGNYVDMAVCEKNGTWTHEDWKAITIDGNATCISTRDADIIAWKPLPTPYKGGDEHETD